VFRITIPKKFIRTINEYFDKRGRVFSQEFEILLLIGDSRNNIKKFSKLLKDRGVVLLLVPS